MHSQVSLHFIMNYSIEDSITNEETTFIHAN